MWFRFNWQTINLWTVELNSNQTLEREFSKRMSSIQCLLKTEIKSHNLFTVQNVLKKKIHL